MKKLLTILALVSFMGIFSACEEEEIVPAEDLEATGGDANGAGTAEGDWD